MNLRLLIDGIVRQTTVLIAQLSTTSGVRSPLAQLADQVFLQLARELESQGVTRVVAADMFGMALRAYQKKLARVAESASIQGTTLWQAVYEFIESESPTRVRVMERFRNDGEREVTSVLRDLVSNGLAFATGEGNNVCYGVTSEHMQAQVLRARDSEAILHLVWLKVFQGIGTANALAHALGLTQEEVQQALDDLHAASRIQLRDGDWYTRQVHIPIGAAVGTEAAILDHFRAVCNVLVSRSRASMQSADPALATRTPPADGGSTFCFAIHPGHPHEQEVVTLLEQTRQHVQRLWEKVSEHNRQNKPHPEAHNVTFYCGQVTATTDEGENTGA